MHFLFGVPDEQLTNNTAVRKITNSQGIQKANPQQLKESNLFNIFEAIAAIFLLEKNFDRNELQNHIKRFQNLKQREKKLNVLLSSLQKLCVQPTRRAFEQLIRQIPFCYLFNNQFIYFFHKSYCNTISI